MALSDLNALINASAANTASRQQSNVNTFNGLASAYVYLGFGVPTIDGLTSLINNANATNFGAGASGAIFNAENVQINAFVSLYRFNTDAANAFNAIIAGSGSLQDALTKVYNSMVPAASQSDAGRSFFLSSSAFYQARAAELGLSGINGAAIVGAAALANIVVTNDIGGLGDSINDLRQAIADGSAVIPQSGAAFTPVETADGTKFDADDSSASVGKTFTLTNNVDGPGGLAPATNTDGTEQNDLYIGTFDSANGDFINGKGGDDTLRLVGQNTATVSLTSVERVEGNAQGGAATFNLAGSTGVKTLASSGSSQDLTFTGLASLVETLEVKNQSAGNVTVNYNGAAIAGTADSQKIVIENYGLKTAPAGTIQVNGVETFTGTVTGTNNFTALTGDTLQTVTLEGSGSLEVGGAFGTTVKNFDASKVTGNVKVAFADGGDVAVKTGTGADRVVFEGVNGFTTKDTVDLGTSPAGTLDILALQATNLNANNEQVKAINATKGAEVLEITGGGGLTLDSKLVTNAEITKVLFNNAGGELVNNASTILYAYGPDNAGGTTFVLAGANTTLNLAYEATSKATGVLFNDADTAGLDTGTALTVNISSTGTTDASINFTTGVNQSDFNNVNGVNNAANATFNITGDANTNIGGFNNPVNIQAGALKGALIASGSAGADVIVGGLSKNLISGGNGIDNIDISKSATVAGDHIVLNTSVLAADRDVVTGFQAGASGDIVRLSAAATTAPTAGGATIAIQEVNSNTGNYIFQSNNAAGGNDLIEFSFNIAGNTLAADADGSTLLAAIGTLTMSADDNDGYLVAYQNGNAFLYHVNDSAVADGGVVDGATEIQLIGTFNGVAVGAFDTSNFLLV